MDKIEKMTELEVKKADITTLKVDAIVNAANDSLRPGAGVCGAIHHAAGPELAQACKALQGCPTGSAKITPGFKLPAKYVIHAVGPIWHGGSHHEPELLAACYEKALTLAIENHIETIAFPAISCGIYGYPIDQAVDIAVATVEKFILKNTAIKKVYFVAFSDEIFSAYSERLKVNAHD